MMLTTGECAELLNVWADAPGGYTSDFVLGEIDDHRLIARVHSRGTGRQRRRIRIHPEDLIAYIKQHHQQLDAKARAHFHRAA
jgi:hypothetical protein